jgi:DNA (cytosine-5)-methyltransferase 1
MHLYEFFAGGGLARLGFGAAATCLFANDIDRVKADTYARNFGAHEFLCADIQALSTVDLPGQADVAWASFPCQDLSQAGKHLGLAGARSRMFWEFHRLMEGLVSEGRAPAVIVLENVKGALSSNKGRDLATICRALGKAGFRFGPLVVDAAAFLPHSRPRLFVIAVRRGVALPPALVGTERDAVRHPAGFDLAFRHLTAAEQANWIWWAVPDAAARSIRMSHILERIPVGVAWDPRARTHRLLSMMSEKNREKVAAARRTGMLGIAVLAQRTRTDSAGKKLQRVEARFDGMAGCLRTPAGGSSLQRLLFVDGEEVRSRRLSPREAARLMGVPDDYDLPSGYNDAMRLLGDGVAVPVVAFLVRHLLAPLVAAAGAQGTLRAAA